MKTQKIVETKTKVVRLVEEDSYFSIRVHPKNKDGEECLPNAFMIGHNYLRVEK